MPIRLLIPFVASSTSSEQVRALDSK